MSIERDMIEADFSYSLIANWGHFINVSHDSHGCLQDWFELLRFLRWVVAVSLPPSNGRRRRRSAPKAQAVIHLNRKCYTQKTKIEPENTPLEEEKHL